MITFRKPYELASLLWAGFCRVTWQKKAAGASSTPGGATLIPSMLQQGIDRPLHAGWIWETRKGRWLLPIHAVICRWVCENKTSYIEKSERFSGQQNYLSVFKMLNS